MMYFLSADMITTAHMLNAYVNFQSQIAFEPTPMAHLLHEPETKCSESSLICRELRIKYEQ